MKLLVIGLIVIQTVLLSFLKLEELAAVMIHHLPAQRLCEEVGCSRTDVVLSIFCGGEFPDPGSSTSWEATVRLTEARSSMARPGGSPISKCAPHIMGYDTRHLMAHPMKPV